MHSETERQGGDSSREFLRHALATLAYRAGKTFRGAPQDFATFRIAEKTRTPQQIVAHMGDLFDWALSLAKGKHEWRDSPPLPWDQGTQRFFAAVQAFDDYLKSGDPLGFSVEELFQGPVADALSHVGQIAMLRRLAGGPIKGENYLKANIQAGRAGPDQLPPNREFE